MPLHIGVAGPCSPRVFASDLDLPEGALPIGLGGTPVNHLVRAWLDSGLRVTLATLDRGHFGRVPTVYRGEQLTLTVGAYRARRRARDAFWSERQAITAGLLQDPPDAISAHWSYEFALGAIATEIPTLVTVRDVPREIFRMQPTPYRLVRWAMHRSVMRRAAQLAFNSPYTQERLGHPRAASGVVLPNALPDAGFILPPRHAPSPEAPKFISVNNGFGSRKNVSRLLEAFHLVRGKVPGAHLTLLGEGFEPGGPAWVWAQGKHLDGGVEFGGPLGYGEVLASIAASDVLVHPSLEESFGYTLIEAASVGTPAIAGQESGAVPWVLAEGDAGVLADVGNSDSIAAAMLELSGSPCEWRSLRAKAFEVTKERFSASRVAEEYVKELRGLLT